MSDVHEIELTGCAPEPLMSYLKSLGILRLVSEQVDDDVVACWRNDVFVLRAKLDREGLTGFFLRAYRPTPIIGPWAGGSGFFEKDNRKAVQAILESQSPRAMPYRHVIEQAREILNEQGVTEKPSEDLKSRLLRRYRLSMPDDFVRWMDAAMVLQSNGQSFAPVLGTGGNDGRLDFTQNFMQRLVDLKLFSTRPSPRSQALLDQALFGSPVADLGKAAVGQFSPGRAGGPNATQGMEGNPTDNPWDFVLMLEGTLILAGSVVRRFGVASTDKAAFPFTGRARPVGEGAPSEEELSGARGELWLPLWSRYVARPELETLFAEGRVELSRRPARDAVDFARAVAGLGVDRGVHSFARFGFLKRSGKAYLAAAMDRFQVPKRPREVTDLLERLDTWLDRFRRTCSVRETPGRLKTALHRVEAAIFDYCRYGRREDMLVVLVTLGAAQRELAVTGGQRGSKEICRPLSRLSPQWLKATHDSSVEYDVALALAGIHDRSNMVEPIRSNIEPVKWQAGRWMWRESGPHMVWNSANLTTNMQAVLGRRLMDGARGGCDRLPLDFKRGAPRDVVAAFIAGAVDDRRIEALLRGLVLIDHRQRYPRGLPRAQVLAVPPLPRQYALLKLMFLPWPLVRNLKESGPRWRLGVGSEEGMTIRPEPRVLPLLRAGRVADACRIAYQRLRASGLRPLPGPKPSAVSPQSDWEPSPSIDPQRLAAALLLPVGIVVVNQLIRLVTRHDEPKPEHLVTEGAVES